MLEYTGEIIEEPTVDSREYALLPVELCIPLISLPLISLISKGRGRNYVFARSGEFSFDAANAGNETRFINHARERKANCIARRSSKSYTLLLLYHSYLYGPLVRLVNGEHRIGIFASMFLQLMCIWGF